MQELKSSREGVIIEKVEDKKGMDMDTCLMMMKCGNMGNDRSQEEIATSLLILEIDILEMTIVGMIGKGDTMATETAIEREINGDMMIEIEIEIVDILTVIAIAIGGGSTCTFQYWL